MRKGSSVPSYIQPLVVFQGGVNASLLYLDFFSLATQVSQLMVWCEKRVRIDVLSKGQTADSCFRLVGPHQCLYDVLDLGTLEKPELLWHQTK